MELFLILAGSYMTWGGKLIETAIRKDTIIVPAGSYEVVAVELNNPGYWFCTAILSHAFSKVWELSFKNIRKISTLNFHMGLTRLVISWIIRRILQRV